MKLKKMLLVGLSGCCLPLAWGQARPPADLLGVGLLVLNEQNTSFFTKVPPLFRDSLLAGRLPALTPERTTCPTCMACAEPVAYHKGVIRPFSCGSEGMQFICTKKAAGYTEISLGKPENKAYLKPGAGTFYTWNAYMRHQASLGEYFTFVRQYDRTVLYDQPYDRRHLPRPTAALTVGLNIKNISELKFYPVLVNGYWLKLRFTEDGKTTRYAWLVWRTEKAWLHGFHFRTD